MKLSGDFNNAKYVLLELDDRLENTFERHLLEPALGTAKSIGITIDNEELFLVTFDCIDNISQYQEEVIFSVDKSNKIKTILYCSDIYSYEYDKYGRICNMYESGLPSGSGSSQENYYECFFDKHYNSAIRYHFEYSFGGPSYDVLNGTLGRMTLSIVEWDNVAGERVNHIDGNENIEFLSYKYSNDGLRKLMTQTLLYDDYIQSKVDYL